MTEPMSTGILVQLPLPKHIDEEKVLDSISPLKDVDGFIPRMSVHSASASRALCPVLLQESYSC